MQYGLAIAVRELIKYARWQSCLNSYAAHINGILSRRGLREHH